MKILTVIFGIFCVVASVIMVNLTRDGVSIRSAPIIGPSPQGVEQKNVAVAVVSRLFPDFQNADYVVIGSSSEFKIAPQIINDLKLVYEQQFRKNIRILADSADLNLETLAKCEKPCWILTSETQSNELSINNRLPKMLDSLENVNHFHLTLIPFRTVPNPSETCIAEKRLSLSCITELSIHEVSKKFKDPMVSYFFMRKYQDRDYFLFIQTAN